MDAPKLNPSRSRLLCEHRAKKWFVLQAIKFWMHDILMLGQDLKRGPHAVRSKKVNGGFERRTVLFQLRDHVLDAEPHQKTQLIGKASRLEATFFTGAGQAREIHMGRHVLLSDTEERFFTGGVL